MASKKRTVVQRIRDAFEADRGIRLTVEDVNELYLQDDALQTLASNDDQDDLARESREVGGSNG